MRTLLRTILCGALFALCVSTAGAESYQGRNLMVTDMGGPYDFRAVRGLTDGVSIVEVNGANDTQASAAAEACWTGSTSYTFVAEPTAATLYVSATDDTTCTQILTLTGLDANSAAQTATVQLNGTTQTTVYLSYTGATSATAVTWTYLTSVASATAISTPTYVYTTCTVTSGVPTEAENMAYIDDDENYTWGSLAGLSLFVSASDTGTTTDTEVLSLAGINSKFAEQTATVQLVGPTATQVYAAYTGATSATQVRWLALNDIENASATDLVSTNTYAYTTCTVTLGIPQRAISILGHIDLLDGMSANRGMAAIYMVPLAKTLYVDEWYATAEEEGESASSFMVREYGGAWLMMDHRQTQSEQAANYKC